MAKVCESCDALEKSKYWAEVPPAFFKIMVGNFENQLRIPRKFIECFPGDLSCSCMLRGQSGNVWEVQLIKSKKDVLFSDGWGNFVRDHNIKIGYFLVFHHVGDSTFDVSVFDTTGCENERSHFTKKSIEVQTFCSSNLHSENTNKRRRRAGLTATNKGKEKVEEVVESEVEMTRVPNFQTSNTFGSTEEDLGNKTNQEFQEEFHKSLERQSKTYYISKRRKVTEQEKQAAIYRADVYMLKKRKKTSRQHMFKLNMGQTHVTCGFHLTIPQQWALKHMLRTTHEVKLQVPEIKESWIVGCRWTLKQCQITSGWSTFVLQNNLEQHDVCVFELVKKGKPAKKRKPMFDVHIFRVVDEEVPLSVSRIA